MLHGPGEHELTMDDFDTKFLLVGVRILVDPADAGDVADVNALQDQLQVRDGSAEPFVPPNYDEASFTATREALLQLARGIGGFDRSFGRKEAVDPVRHLTATAAGWGGLPEQEAYYVNVDPGLPVGEYEVTVDDVPVDAFWSISLCNAAGYFDANDRNSYSVDNITATPNYTVRLYRPRPEILDGSWVFPAIEPATTVEGPKP